MDEVVGIDHTTEHRVLVVLPQDPLHKLNLGALHPDEVFSVDFMQIKTHIGETEGDSLPTVYNVAAHEYTKVVFLEGNMATERDRMYLVSRIRSVPGRKYKINHLVNVDDVYTIRSLRNDRED